MKLRLFHYWRSSSSRRVRWAFALKGIPCEMVPVNLLTGESESEEHLKRNPLGYVPALELIDEPKGSSRFLIESMAIIQWAEETYPSPTLLPGSALDRATVRQLAEIISSDTQPLQNLNPQFLHSDDPEKRKAWAQHWIRNGLQAYEKLAGKTAGRYSFGDSITLADLCLIPQCYNAGRNDVSIDDYPTISRVYKAALQTEACQASAPERFAP